MTADARSRLVELSHRAENGEFCLNCRDGVCPSNEILAICDRALKPTEAYFSVSGNDNSGTDLAKPYKATDLNSPVETPPMPAPTPQTHPYKRTDLNSAKQEGE